MKRYIKITIWAILAIVLVGVCVIGGLVLKNYLQDKMSPAFEETTIFPDNKFNPTDTVLTVNGIDVKMVGIRSGKVCCEGLRDTIELQDFYIAETEVTQKLWTAIMGNNPSGNQECDSLPVESVDLVECLDFVHKLDSVSGLDFYIPSYPQWVYAANLGKCDSNQTHSSGKTFDDFAWWKNNSKKKPHPVKEKEPNALGIYDMLGNVSEWTISGSDPLFYMMGGSYASDQEHCDFELHEIYHANMKVGETGLRLVYYPKMNSSEK